MSRHPTAAVIDDIVAERRRQIEDEGWSIEHDDGHDRGELARAAAAYAVNASYSDKVLRQRAKHGQPPAPWPQDWEWKHSKRRDRRRDLVCAAALIVAEIERLDRGGRTL